jgi:hypothetical protein
MCPAAASRFSISNLSRARLHLAFAQVGPPTRESLITNVYFNDPLTGVITPSLTCVSPFARNPKTIRFPQRHRLQSVVLKLYLGDNHAHDSRPRAAPWSVPSPTPTTTTAAGRAAVPLPTSAPITPARKHKLKPPSRWGATSPPAAPATISLAPIEACAGPQDVRRSPEPPQTQGSPHFGLPEPNPPPAIHLSQHEYINARRRLLARGNPHGLRPSQARPSLGRPEPDLHVQKSVQKIAALTSRSRNPCRINSYTSLSKQMTLSSFKINTYKNGGGEYSEG